MKKGLIIGFGLVLLGLMSWTSTDVPKGYINWKAANKFYKAEGSFGSWAIKNLVYHPDSLLNTTLEVEVDISSVQEKSDKLASHLKEEDYFNMALFPKAVVSISHLEQTDTAYKAQFITHIKSIADTTEGYFQVLSKEPLKVQGYAYINRPKHQIGMPLNKSKGITEMVRVDFMLDLGTKE